MFLHFGDAKRPDLIWEIKFSEALSGEAIGVKQFLRENSCLRNLSCVVLKRGLSLEKYGKTGFRGNDLVETCDNFITVKRSAPNYF